MLVRELETVWAPRMLSVMRIMLGLLYLQSGTGKFLGIPLVPAYANIRPFQLFWWAGVVEITCGTLIVLGLFTRGAAFLASGEMAFAYFISHAPRNFFPLLNDGRPAVAFCFVFLYLVFAGGGPWSVDAILRRKGVPVPLT
jgi:putative oxidoreductase